METLFWIQRELARYFPDADFFHGVDLNTDGEIQPWEEVRDENGNGEFGDKTDWEFFYYRNEEFLKLFPGPLHWAGIFRFDNPLHDRMSLEMEVLSEEVIENGYRKLDKIVRTMLYGYGLVNRNVDNTIAELVYDVVVRHGLEQLGAFSPPFLAETLNHESITAEQKGWVTAYVEYELGQSSQVLMETIDKNLEFLRELVPAKRYLQKGEFQPALREADRLVKRHPHSAAALTLRGEARMNLKDFDGAVGDLKKALRIDPKFLEPFHLLMDLFLKEGKLSECHRFLQERMVSRRLVYPLKVREWAEIFLRGGMTEEANDLYELLYQMNVGTGQLRAESAYAITRHWLQLGEAHPKLFGYMDEAIRIAPSNADYYRLRGDLHFQGADYDKVMADHRKGMGNVEQEVTYNIRATAGYSRAVADYGKAEGLGISDLEMFYKRGQAHYKLKRYESAASDLEKAVQGDPKNGEANKLLGEVQLLLHRDKDLVATLDRQIALEPAVAGYYLQRAEAKARLGDCDGVIADCNEVEKLDPSVAEVDRLRGECYAKKEAMDKAVDYFSRGLSKAPRDRRLLLSRGEVRLRQKKYREAIRDFESVIALSAGAKDKLEQDARVLRLEAAKKMILGED